MNDDELLILLNHILMMIFLVKDGLALRILANLLAKEK
jgi:hypothetical protein